MIVGSESSDAIANFNEDSWIVHPVPGYVVKFKEVWFYFSYLSINMLIKHDMLIILSSYVYKFF